MYGEYNELFWFCVAAVGPRGGGCRDILIDGFTPPSTSVAPMFPFYENNSEWDDFGEVINPDDYVIKDEDMNQGAMLVSFCSEISDYWFVQSLIIVFLILVFSFWVDSDMHPSECKVGWGIMSVAHLCQFLEVYIRLI